MNSNYKIYLTNTIFRNKLILVIQIIDFLNCHEKLIFMLINLQILI